MIKFLNTVNKSFNNKKLIISKLIIQKIQELAFFKLFKKKKDSILTTK
jgi:hypothetical protein